MTHLNCYSRQGKKDLSEQCISEVNKFVVSNMYAGRKGETIIDARVRLYKSIKTKSSQALPPDADSLKQALLRVHYQVFHWLRCNKRQIPSISLEDKGWTIDTEESVVRTIWFIAELIFNLNVFKYHIRLQQLSCIVA